jgi:hypothetical protein
MFTSRNDLCGFYGAGGGGGGGGGGQDSQNSIVLNLTSAVLLIRVIQKFAGVKEPKGKGAAVRVQAPHH